MSNDNQNGQQKKPRAAEQQILSLGQLLQNMREDDSVDALIKTTIAYLQEGFDYPFLWIALYDESNKTLYGKGGLTPDGETSYLRRSIVIKPGNFLERVVTQLCPLGIANLRGESRASEWQEVANRYNIQGTILLPIRYKENCLGLVLLGSQRWGYLLSGEARAKLLIVIGELGILLYKNSHNNTHNKPENPPTQALLQLLENVRSANNLNKRLEAVVDATHKFISPSRTNIYWLEREGNYFWCRMSNNLVNISSVDSHKPGAIGITVQELSDVYYALSVNQVVWINETASSLKTNVKGKLLQRLGVKSILAAPIIWQKDLLGFLSVESHELRNWLEEEKHFVQGAAGLVSLVAPSEIIEGTIRQIQQDTQLTNQVAQAIYKEQGLDSALHICAGRILERLTATRFVLLQYNPTKNIYQVIFQSIRHHRRLWTFDLKELTEIDIQLLQNAKQALEIENFEADLRFLNWRRQLLDNGVRSLLICNCAQGQTPELLLLITHETNRSWKTLEKELLWVFSQNIGVVVHHWRLRDNTKDQQKISQGFKEYLNILTHTQSSTNETELAALKQIASVLEVPLAIILSSNPSQNWAKILPGVISNHQFGVVLDFHVSLEKDVIAELAIAHNSYLILKAEDLPAETRQWLTIPNNSKVFVMALRTSTENQPTSIVVLADYEEQNWREISINATVTLIHQLAWWQNQQQIIQNLESHNENLHKLNWYKHSRLEEIHRMSTLVLGQIRDLGIPANELTQMRYKLLLRQLDYITSSMTSMIKQEQWDLHTSVETMSISSLLKRAVERVDNLSKQQQLWIGIHGLGQSNDNRELSPTSSLAGEQTMTGSTLATTGDIVKIELVLHELLVAACQRSPIGDRVDIWCRPLDEKSLEISITDNGSIEPQLLAEFNQAQFSNTFSTSHISQPPGLHLVICKKMMQQLGGELQLYQLPDKRVVSRLLLPLASQNHEGSTLGSTSSFLGNG
ncbi:GAF domain-containing protein [Anabaena sp. UHCC 0253]|uniref:sensor histidine kinase n=1 Tax=Anabaena sp. UHCC 0253 TaxID=2590019 RepID=UPI001444D41A|nr:GAF domain-containing protein [Anabaena sp. UHCC 0253]MTJ51430.1 GAF domain-containing protein [Anabaena sp. UHCC 0253]